MGGGMGTINIEPVKYPIAWPPHMKVVTGSGVTDPSVIARPSLSVNGPGTDWRLSPRAQSGRLVTISAMVGPGP